MTTPFTTEQFFGVFVAYNAAIWPAQIGAYVLGLVAIAGLWRRRPKLVLAILALMWLWNAIGYHYLFFSSINPGAKLFAGLFALQGLLLALCPLASANLSFFVARDLRTAAGLTFIAPRDGTYALHGTASYLKGPLTIEHATLKGDWLRFSTRSQEMLGDSPWKEARHQYIGKITPAGIAFTLETTGGYSIHPPVEFVARRSASPRIEIGRAHV